MEVSARLRRSLADSDDSSSLASRFRARRFAALLARFPNLDRLRVLDLGGTPSYWLAAPVRPASLVVLNLSRDELSLGGEVHGITLLVGDACDPPSDLDRGAFDLVVSNSVIEHVGGHARRLRFAANVDRLAPHHWVQTPYRYFPVEPHWVFPGMQFLPTSVRARVAEKWPLAPAHPTGPGAVNDVLSVELLTRTEMRFYFPASDLISERVAGLTKSLIAVA